MSTAGHVIDEKYIMGKIANGVTRSTNENIRGHVIAIEVGEFGDIFITVEPLDGSPIIMIPLEGSNFGRNEETIPCSITELTEALRVASDHRSSIVNNITYARQISGEDTSVYESELKKCDLICERLGNELNKANLNG